MSEKPGEFKKIKVRISASNVFFSSESPYQKMGPAKILEHLDHFLLIDMGFKKDFTL